MSGVEVTIAQEVTPELMNAFARLIPQLSSSNPPPSEVEVAEILGSSWNAQFVASVEGRIVGLLTLATFRIPTGLRAWIEDVVVDGEARGMGVGEKLNTAALDEARRRGARTVDLTSRPSREAANRLYQRIGFELRTSNLYRYDL